MARRTARGRSPNAFGNGTGGYRRVRAHGGAVRATRPGDRGSRPGRVRNRRTGSSGLYTLPAMIVRFTSRATADLDAIFAYIAKDNPPAAARVINRIEPFAISRQGSRLETTRHSEACGYALSLSHPLPRAAKPFGSPDPASRTWWLGVGPSKGCLIRFSAPA